MCSVDRLLEALERGYFFLLLLLVVLLLLFMLLTFVWVIFFFDFCNRCKKSSCLPN